MEFRKIDGCESEWTPGVGDGQEGLACCSPWSHKESDTTERLNWTHHREWLDWLQTNRPGGRHFPFSGSADSHWRAAIADPGLRSFLLGHGWTLSSWNLGSGSCFKVIYKWFTAASSIFHHPRLLQTLNVLFFYGNDNPICEAAKETQMYRTVFWTLWKRARVGWFGRMALKHVQYLCETNRQSRFNAWDRVLWAGALGWPRGMGWGGTWEGASGWGTRVHPWWIHVDIWQNQYNIVK